VAAAGGAEGVGQGRWRVDDLQEEAGRGLSALVSEVGGAGPARRLLLGSAHHVGGALDAAPAVQQVFLAWHRDGAPAQELARFELSEDLRPESAAVVRALQRDGVEVLLLSGDRAQAAAGVAGKAGIARWQGDCSPQDKLRVLRDLQAQGRQVAMVGDGLNDGPVLAGAHVSFAFGRAVPLAQSRSDLVVLGDDLALIAQSITLAKRTIRVVRQNLWWAAGYNALSVPLAIAGYMPAWLAGLGMALSSLLVVLNAARLSLALPALPEEGAGARLAVAPVVPSSTRLA
jgi:Cu2+-exporting ATPase